MFNLEFTPKYLKKSRYLVKKNLTDILEKVLKIEDILEDGSWLQFDVKKHYKTEKLYYDQGNLWKCKYIYGWRLIFAVDENIITLTNLDKRDTIYSNLLII